MAETVTTTTPAEAQIYGFFGTATYPSPLDTGAATLKGAVVNSDDPPLHGKPPEPDK